MHFWAATTNALEQLSLKKTVKILCVEMIALKNTFFVI